MDTLEGEFTVHVEFTVKAEDKPSARLTVMNALSRHLTTRGPIIDWEVDTYVDGPGDEEA